MNREELITRFSVLSDEELRAKLDQYDEQLGRMMFMENMTEIMDAKEVVEEILKERENGAK